MIPSAYITEWQDNAPWIEDYQVEQDLIISRALCEIYSEPLGEDCLAFRGGTALQKIFFKKPHRYSEDIDLVQINREPIGAILDYFRQKLQPWLGKPKFERGDSRVTLKYKYTSENEPKRDMKLKVEINTGEHLTVLGYHKIPFAVESSWYTNKVEITTFQLEEILGTKLRALYQRRKGRDLFDFSKAFEEFSIADQKIIDCFHKYMEHEGNKIFRSEFEINMEEKMKTNSFLSDITPLLASGEEFDIKQAAETINKRLISKLHGNPKKVGK